MKIIGQAATDVTATAVRVGLADLRMPNTLLNTGSKTLYYRYNPDSPAGKYLTMTPSGTVAGMVVVSAGP